MYRKLTIFIDSALKRKLEQFPEEIINRGFKECFDLVGEIQEYLADQKTEFEWSTHRRNLCALHAGRYFALFRLFKEANRMELTIKYPQSTPGYFLWVLKLFGKNKKNESAEINIYIDSTLALSSLDSIIFK